MSLSVFASGIFLFAILKFVKYVITLSSILIDSRFCSKLLCPMFELIACHENIVMWTQNLNFDEKWHCLVTRPFCYRRVFHFTFNVLDTNSKALWVMVIWLFKTLKYFQPSPFPYRYYRTNLTGQHFICMIASKSCYSMKATWNSTIRAGWSGG